MIILSQEEVDDIRTIARLSNSPVLTDHIIRLDLDPDEFDITFNNRIRQYILEIDVKNILDNATPEADEHIIFDMQGLKSAFYDAINYSDNISIDLKINNGIKFNTGYVIGHNASSSLSVSKFRFSFFHDGFGWAVIKRPANIYKVGVRIKTDLISYGNKSVVADVIKFIGIIIYISVE